MKKLTVLVICVMLIFSLLPSASADWWQDLKSGRFEGAETLWDSVKEGTGSLWNEAKDEAIRLWGGFSSDAKELWSKYSGDIKSFFSGLYGFALDSWDKAKVFGTDAWLQIKNSAAPLYEKIAEEADNVWKSVSGNAADAWDWLKDEAKNVSQEVRTDYLTVLDWLKDTVPEDPAEGLSRLLRRYGISEDKISNIINYMICLAAEKGLDQSRILSAASPVIIYLINRAAKAEPGTDLAELPMDELIISLVNPWMEKFRLTGEENLEKLLPELIDTLENAF